MSLHLSPFDSSEKGTLSRRPRSARRIGEIISLLFLASLGTVATMTGTRADGQAKTAAPIASATPLSATTH